MYTVKTEILPSFLLILLGSIDCITTVIGVMYFGASELNPFMTAIISSSMAGFLVLKISASFLIGVTYIYAKRTLNKAMDKSSKAYKTSRKIMKGAYASLIIFLMLAVINNLFVLIG
jgi:hypothetical protein